MAIINTPKSFDKAQIDSAILGKIEPFVDYINQQFDQITRALQNQLTFADNFKAKVVIVSAVNNQELSLNETASQIIPLSVLGDSIRQYSATVSNSGVQKITFKFGNAVPIRVRNATSSSPAAPFATFEVETTTNLQAGDKVVVTSQVNADNNGTFVIAKVSSSSIQVYHPTATTTTVATSYTGAYEVAKQVTLLLLS